MQKTEFATLRIQNFPAELKREAWKKAIDNNMKLPEYIIKLVEGDIYGKNNE